jgi:hypothetical protein
MIVFGVCVGPSDKYERICHPSLPKGALVLTRTNQVSIFSAYNSILDEAAEIPDMEAVALIHDDIEVGPSFEQDVRIALNTGAGVVGAIGSLDPFSLAWWKGHRRGYAVEPGRIVDHGVGFHEVHTVDGMAMVLSPECARSVRFDAKTFSGGHAYDIDFCFEASTRGYRILVAPLDVRHHTKGTLGDVLAYRRADLALQSKWKLTPKPTLFLRRAKLAAVVARSTLKR